MADPCAPIQEEIQKLSRQIQQIKGSHGYIQGPHDPNPGRPDPEMLQEVRRASALLGQKTAEYDQCVVARGGKLDLPAVLTGLLSFTGTHSTGVARGQLRL